MQKAIAQGANAPGVNSPIRRALGQAAAIYRGDMLRRYNRLARGGGEWPPLSKATLVARSRRTVQRVSDLFGAGLLCWNAYEKKLRAARKRHAKQKERIKAGLVRASILIDTGTLRNVLNPTLSGQPGHYERYGRGEVTVGYGGPGRHGGKGSRRAITVAAIAAAHQYGRGVPRRRILVAPSPQALGQITRAFDAALSEVVRAAQGGVA